MQIPRSSLRTIIKFCITSNLGNIGKISWYVIVIYRVGESLLHNFLISVLFIMYSYSEKYYVNINSVLFTKRLPS